MRKTLLILLATLLYGGNFYGQTKVDDLVSIEFPGTVLRNDTTQYKPKVLKVYTKKGDELYLLQRLAIYREEDLKRLPASAKQLDDFYKEILAGLIKGMERNGYLFRDSTQIKQGGFKAYSLTYEDLKSGKQCAESKVILLNKSIYSATYASREHFDFFNKDNFLSSLTIDMTKNPQQIVEGSLPTSPVVGDSVKNPSSAYKMGYKFGRILGKAFFFVLIIAIVLFIVIKVFRTKKI